MRRLLRPIWFLLAILFLIEAWIWERLEPTVEWVVARLPFARLKRAIAAGVMRLNPYATLLLFALPGLVLLPFKLAGLWLIGNGHAIAGALVFLLAKTVGVAVSAFLFEICGPKLMELAWFRAVRDWALRTKAWAKAQTEPARLAIRAWKQRILGERGRMLAFAARLRRRSRRRLG